MDATAATAATRVQTSGESSFEDAYAKLDGEAFLQLLVAQLTHQNPLEPMKNQEFMSQLTDMSSLEELQKISAAFDHAAAAGRLGLGASLLGRQVQWRDATGEEVAGTVEEVIKTDEELTLSVEGVPVPLSAVTRVISAPTPATAPSAVETTEDPS